jgi:hypothetical protein
MLFLELGSHQCLVSESVLNKIISPGHAGSRKVYTDAPVWRRTVRGKLSCNCVTESALVASPMDPLTGTASGKLECQLEGPLEMLLVLYWRRYLTRMRLGAILQRYICEFLFNGVNTLGEKEFLDYFPEYRGADGGIIKQRSVVGKSYEVRPWNKDGIFAPSLI